MLRLMPAAHTAAWKEDTANVMLDPMGKRGTPYLWGKEAPAVRKALHKRSRQHVRRVLRQSRPEAIERQRNSEGWNTW